jgi:hypothetical protein
LNSQSAGFEAEPAPASALGSESSTEAANRLVAKDILQNLNNAGPLTASRDAESVQRLMTGEISREVVSLFAGCSDRSLIGLTEPHVMSLAPGRQGVRVRSLLMAYAKWLISLGIQNQRRIEKRGASQMEGKWSLRTHWTMTKLIAMVRSITATTCKLVASR